MQKYDAQFRYKPASAEELERIWDKTIASHPGDGRWPIWKTEYTQNNRAGKCLTFLILDGDDPIGEGTLLFSPQCSAIGGRTQLADGIHCANINALRIEKAYEGKGHISKLVKLMEQYAKDAGYSLITIGVEPKESRNLGIYLHWGYDRFIELDKEEGDLVLYYAKALKK